MTQKFIPRYKLILFYDLAGQETQAYYQFIMTEMIPALHEKGLIIFQAFHTIPGPDGGDIQMRQVEFVARDLETVRGVLNSDMWAGFEIRLRQHATNYSRKIVHFRQGFQL